MKKHKIILSGLVLSLYSATAIAGGIPTFDSANVIQSTITARESITQTAQQLQQYQTQLQQLQNQIQNTANPASFQWDNANTTIDNILSSMNTISTYESQAGGINSYLDKFSDANYYQNTSCIKTGCTSAQLKHLNSNEYASSQAQKMANDDMWKSIVSQQAQLKSDASNLAILQQNAQNSTGQMQAIQAANQLASNQIAQLLQIRQLMLAQQTAEVTRQQIISDREAKQKAAHDAAFSTRQVVSPAYNIIDYTNP